MTELTTYEYEDELFFNSNEIIPILGYKNVSQTLKNVSLEYLITFRDFKGNKEPKIDPRTILISKYGISEFLTNTSTEITEDIDNILKKYHIDFRELLTYSYISNGLCFEYFVGYEITTLLGYKNPNQTIKCNVSKSNQLVFREYPGVKIPEQDPKTILITREGVCDILLKTRKRLTPDVLHILKKFQIETTNKKCLTKEQQTLSAIGNAFKTEKYEDQYKIDNYYLDLYFTEYKIVVECDENGHSDRKPCDERERMDYVNRYLNIDDTHWIRYNPDEYDFDISKVIGKIYIKLEEEKSRVKYVDEVIFRKCRVCGNKKELTESNFKPYIQKNHKGFSSTCNCCVNDTAVNNEKAVRQYNLDGTFVREYTSVREASRETKIHESNIAGCCRGAIKSIKKYLWKYLEDLNIEVEEDEENTDNIEPIKYELYKCVAQYDKDGNFVKKYKSVAEAARELNVRPRSLYGAIRNNFVSHGYVWRYIDKNIEEKIEPVLPYKKYMRPVEIYKDDILYKTFNSIRDSANGMKVNVSMARKFLAGKTDPKNFVWKFKLI
jgi:very-short-patch-repair endonuclease